MYASRYSECSTKNIMAGNFFVLAQRVRIELASPIPELISKTNPTAMTKGINRIRANCSADGSPNLIAIES